MFSWHLPNSDSSIREHVSTSPESRGGGFIPLQLTLGTAHLRLECSCLAMETHFMKLLLYSSCNEAAWSNLMRNATNYFLYKLFSSFRASLQLCGWTVFACRRFHFIITVLTVGSGKSSRSEVTQTDMFKVTELFSKTRYTASVCLWSRRPTKNVSWLKLGIAKCQVAILFLQDEERL